jgi:hypothetical protein
MPQSQTRCGDEKKTPPGNPAYGNFFVTFQLNIAVFVQQ